MMAMPVESSHQKIRPPRQRYFDVNHLKCILLPERDNVQNKSDTKSMVNQIGKSIPLVKLLTRFHPNGRYSNP